MLDWLTRHRTVAYLLLNATLLIAVVCGAMVHQVPLGRAVYVVVMLFLCSAPLLLLEKVNGPYALLMIAMGLYFSFFVPVDLAMILFRGGYPPDASAALLTPAECGIIVGGVCAVVAYVAGVRLAQPKHATRIPADWPVPTILFVGLALWAIGTAAVVYLQVFVSPEKTNLSMRKGLESMGPLVTFAMLLCRLLQPLGLLILAYGYSRFRSILWTSVVIAVVLVQIAVGFITDQKLVAITGGLLIILVKTLLERQVPKAWATAGVLFIVLAFPIFQAYRVEVTGERGLDRAQALQNIGKVLQIAFASRNKVMDEEHGARAETFFERASSKANLEAIFARVGVDVPQLRGQTLVAIPTAFVPRLLVPDKMDVPVGQLFAKVFFHSDSDVYLSLSFLGELYWNFGWVGVIVGMLLYGLVLGVIGVRSDLSQAQSVTRLLVLVGTVQTLCMAFGGSIANGVVTWLRSLAAIGLLHVAFARNRSTRPSPIAGTERSGPFMDSSAVARFPNVLR